MDGGDVKYSELEKNVKMLIAELKVLSKNLLREDSGKP
jgi:hypothetical protein